MKKELFLLFFFLTAIHGMAVLPAKCATGALYADPGGASGYNLYVCNPNDTWTLYNGAGGGGIPAGLITFVASGTCPSGWTESAALSGFMLRGTVAANADVGTTGGNDNITPAGTVSQPTFSGAALAGHLHTFTGSLLATHLHGVGTYAAAAPTFTGAALGTHLHGIGTFGNTAISAGTPAGTNAWPVGVPTFTGAASSVIVNHVHVQNAASAATGPLVGSTPDASTNTSVATGYSSANPTGGAASYTPAGTNAWPAGVPTFAGAALATHNHTFSGSSEAVSGGTPAGTNSAPALSGSSSSDSAGTPAGTLDSVSGGTPAGTVSQPTFAGAAFDNRPAFMKVIFCQKT